MHVRRRQHGDAWADSNRTRSLTCDAGARYRHAPWHASGTPRLDDGRMPEVLLRLAVTSWNGLPIASLIIFAFGGLMYAWMSPTPPATRSVHLTARELTGHG